MAREDIKTCIKNGLERGDSVISVKISLANAGYPKQDIDDAMSELKGIDVKHGEVPKPRFLPKLPR